MLVAEGVQGNGVFSCGAQVRGPSQVPFSPFARAESAQEFMLLVFQKYRVHFPHLPPILTSSRFPPILISSTRRLLIMLNLIKYDLNYYIYCFNLDFLGVKTRSTKPSPDYA